MPEGPSLVILREEAAKFAGRRVKHVGGNSRLDIQRMAGQRVQALRTWGQHFLVVFDGFTLRVHFLLWGSYRIDERREGSAERLALGFPNGELNLYSSSLKFLEGDLDDLYDWGADVMSDAWDPKAARRKHPETPVGALSPRKLGELVTQAREYSFDFYRWKKDYVLKKHYQVHTRTECPRCGRRLEFRAKLGRAQRRAFFCGHCQKRYG